jgi:hypothetical protein
MALFGGATEYKECQAFCPVVRIVTLRPLHPQASVSPPLVLRWETHSLVGEGVEGPSTDEWTDTLVLYLYYNPSTGVLYCKLRIQTLPASQQAIF